MIISDESNLQLKTTLLEECYLIRTLLNNSSNKNLRILGKALRKHSLVPNLLFARLAITDPWKTHQVNLHNTTFQTPPGNKDQILNPYLRRTTLSMSFCVSQTISPYFRAACLILSWIPSSYIAGTISPYHCSKTIHNRHKHFLILFPIFTQRRER